MTPNGVTGYTQEEIRSRTSRGRNVIFIMNHKRILVIKLSAFGDFVLSIRSFQAIRAAHPAAKMNLLTTRPFTSLAQESGCFEEIWEDERPKLYQTGKLFALRRKLNQANFDRVYDLQRNDRTALYFHLLTPKPEWVGKIKSAPHHMATDSDAPRHVTHWEDDQLRRAGIINKPCADLSFMTADISEFSIAHRFALLVPGCAAHRLEKRWPATKFSRLAKEIITAVEGGLTPVIIGSKAEVGTCETIAQQNPASMNLCGRTSINQIAELARKARFAVGNDTGPMHLIAAVGCPSLSLFSNASDPQKSCPVGPSVTVLQKENLADLTLEKVLEALPQRPESPAERPD